MKFSEGKHSIKYYAIDNVGNYSDPVKLDFMVDSVPPVTKAVVRGGYYKGEHETFVSGNALVVLETVESHAGLEKIEYTLNGGPVTTYHAPFVVFDQKMEIKFRGIDRAGNVEAWKLFNLTPDAVPPELKLETHGHAIIRGNIYYALPGFEINIVAKDKVSGVAELAVSFDGKNLSPIKENKVVFDKAGEFHFSARITDHVGNVTESNPYVIVIDNIPPVSHIRTTPKLILKDGIYYSGIPSRIEIISEDKGGVGVESIEFSYDNKNFIPYIGAIDATQWTHPRQTIYYRAIDALKNVEPMKTAVVELKNDGPQVDLMIESKDSPNLPKLPVADLSAKQAEKEEIKEVEMEEVKEEINKGINIKPHK